MNKSYKLTISGKVQGVGYRRWFQRQAMQLQVQGWVRNIATGEVEALVITDAGKLENLIECAYQGSPLAQVTEVVWIEIENTVLTNDFQILK
jgi:acylphosphatase